MTDSQPAPDIHHDGEKHPNGEYVPQPSFQDIAARTRFSVNQLQAHAFNWPGMNIHDIEAVAVRASESGLSFDHVAKAWYYPEGFEHA